MLSLALLLLAADPAAASASGRVSTLVVYGNDPCPKGATPDEVIVCARQPESERFRIPKRFRGKKPVAAQGSWANTAASLDQVGRVAGGTPDSCSPVGSGGQTGCQRQFLRQAREQRKLDAAEQAEIGK